MAQTALTIVGYAVGSYFGYPQLGAAVGAYVGGQVEIANTQIQGARLDDLRLPKFEYGSTIPRLWGRNRVPSAPIWMSAKREISTTTGGKGSAEPEVTTYTYECDILYLLCDNEIVAVSRIWANGELVYTALADSDDTSAAASEFTDKWTDLRVHVGGPAQLPDPVYEAAVGAGNAPAYRGRGTVMIEGLQLGNSGQVPVLTFEVLTSATANGRWVEAGENPAHTFAPTSQPVLQWGFGTDAITTMPVLAGPNITLVGTNPGSNQHVATTQEAVNGGKRYFEVMINDASSSSGELGWIVVKDFAGHRYGSNYSGNFTANGTNLGAPGDGPASITWLGANRVMQYAFDLDAGLMWVGAAGVWHGVAGIATDPGTGTNGQAAGTLTPAGCTIELTVQANGPIFAANLRTVRTDFAYPIPDGFTPWASDGDDADAWTPVDVPLADVVQDLCEAAGVPPAQVDVAALAGLTVSGVPVTQVSPARSTLQTLAAAYYFDCVESDKLYFRLRGAAAAATIPHDDLGVAPDTPADGDPVGLERANDLEVPARYALQYINVQDDYQAGTVYSDRIVSQSEETRTTTVPVTLPPEQAQGIVDTLALDMRIGATTLRPAIDTTRPQLEPTDVVQVVDVDGATYRARIVRENYAGGVRTLECVLDDASVLAAVGITDDTSAPNVSVASYSLSDLLLLDIPILRDADDAPGLYGLMRPRYTTGWAGAVLFISSDGAAYTSGDKVTVAAVFGTTTTALGDWTGGAVFDEVNSVTVNVGAATLASATRDAMLEDASLNAAVVNHELLQYRTATLVSAGVYTLSGLLRGRRGTEWAMTGHAAGERFALLKAGGTARVVQVAADIGQTRYFKPVSVGRTLASAEATTLAPTSVGLKPFAPVDLRASRDPTGGLVLAWKRRTRLATQFAGAAGILTPLGEAAEAYEVDILDGATVKRTISAATPGCVYTAAQQAADFGAVQTTVDVRVYQLSAVVGRGTALEATAAVGGYTAAASTGTVTLGGAFVTGVRITVFADAVQIGEHVTVGGDTNLAGAATALAAAITSGGFSAAAVGPVVTVTGPVGRTFVLTASAAGAASMFGALHTPAAPAGPGTAYQAAVYVANFVTGVTEPIPAGTQLALQIEQPIGTYLGTVSYTLPASGTRFDALGGLANAMATHATLAALGYGLGVQSNAQGFYGLLTGPVGAQGVYAQGSGDNGFGLTISVNALGSAAVPVDRPQRTMYFLDGTPAAGQVFTITLGGVPFTYTAGGGDTIVDVASALATAVDASATYSAAHSSAGTQAYVNVYGQANVPFTYGASVSASITVTVA
ncbi:MAG: hypothetical protein IPM06_22130 [Rhizobiales bacterium]|nr:hypothetical protein [Hyphomicrobiales bacterium]